MHAALCSRRVAQHHHYPSSDRLGAAARGPSVQQEIQVAAIGDAKHMGNRMRLFPTKCNFERLSPWQAAHLWPCWSPPHWARAVGKFRSVPWSGVSGRQVQQPHCGQQSAAGRTLRRQGLCSHFDSSPYRTLGARRTRNPNQSPSRLDRQKISPRKARNWPLPPPPPTPGAGHLDVVWRHAGTGGQPRCRGSAMLSKSSANSR